jgi:glucose-6-phosphate 1-dehydrogenase
VRLLSDTLVGDRSLFAREDYIEEAWRIVDPILVGSTPLFHYEPGSWGPDEARRLTPPGGWHDPVLSNERLDDSAVLTAGPRAA